jgi:hypothetical protein
MAKFVNERLVTTNLFGLKGAKQGEPGTEEKVEKTQAPQEVPADSANLDDILRQEASHVRTQALRGDLRELARRRLEVVQIMRETLAEMELRRQELDERRQSLQHIQRQVEELPEIIAESDLESFRISRRIVEQAHLEVVRCAKTRAERAGAASSPELSGLGFGQLTRLGIALAWPLILAIFLAVLLLIGGLMLVFGV